MRFALVLAVLAPLSAAAQQEPPFLMTLTDPTTLSRTVANLRRAGLVNVRRGNDGRTKLLSLSARGRERFAAAMPYWEEAQRRVARLLPVLDVRALASRVYKVAQQS